MKISAKRFLSVMLVLAMALSLLPVFATAATTYTKVVGLSDVTSGGQFVLVANGYAMDTTLQGNKKFNGIAVTPSDNTLSGSLPVWTFETVEGGIAIRANGQYLAYESSTNFMMQAEAYTWTVEAGANGFIIKSAASTKRGVFLQTSSNRFGAYSTTNATGYVFELTLYKEPTADACTHDYVANMTTPVTCTQDGIEVNTCSKCGDTFNKTITAIGHQYVAGVCLNCDGKIETDPSKIIPEAYALEEYAKLPYDAILTGKVISVDEAYNSSYNNITVTIAVEGYEEQPIQCYRLKGTGIEELAVGDEISVFGNIKNHKGTVEFDTGCTVYTFAPEDPEQIVAEAYALEEGASLPYEAVLTGKITAVNTPYSEEFKNITVTMVVENCEDKPIECYRMKGEGVDALKVGDVITVAGTIKNFYGKIEFNLPYLIPNAEEPTPATYYVVGSFNGWTNPDDNYVMNANDDGTYSLSIDVTAGKIELKVTDGTWNDGCNWGDNGNNVVANAVADGTILVTFDPKTGTVLVTGDCLGDLPQMVIESMHVAGEAGLVGAGWDPTVNPMTGDQGVYTLTFTGIAAGTYQFKVVANGTWDLNWATGLPMTSGVAETAWFNAQGNSSIEVAEDDSTVTVTFDTTSMNMVTGEGATLCVTVMGSEPAQGVTVSGKVTTGAEGDTTVELLNGETVVATATVSGEEGNYSFEDVAAGTYTLKVSKANHVTRTYTVTVAAEDVTQDTKIHLIGDLDGNGIVNMGDVGRLYAHVRGTNELTDEYIRLCANVNGGILNMGDTGALYSHVRGTKLLY